LGAGGNGSVVLAYLLDQADVVIDRGVIKMIEGPNNPWNPLHPFDEARYHADLSGMPLNGGHYVAHFRNVERNPWTDNAFLIFMDYCQHDDLWRLIEEAIDQTQVIPEPFVW
jgi:hypothetical protein